MGRLPESVSTLGPSAGPRCRPAACAWLMCVCCACLPPTALQFLAPADPSHRWRLCACPTLLSRRASLPPHAPPPAERRVRLVGNGGGDDHAGVPLCVQRLVPDCQLAAAALSAAGGRQRQRRRPPAVQHSQRSNECLHSNLAWNNRALAAFVPCVPGCTPSSFVLMQLPFCRPRSSPALAAALLCPQRPICRCSVQFVLACNSATSQVAMRWHGAASPAPRLAPAACGRRMAPKSAASFTFMEASRCTAWLAAHAAMHRRPACNQEGPCAGMQSFTSCPGLPP